MKQSVLAILIVCFFTKAFSSTVDFNHYWTQTEITQYLHYLERNFPDVCHVENYGMTQEGRPLEALHIDTHHDHKRSGAKEVIFIEAGLRPREWIGVMTAVYFIHEMVEHYYEFDAILDQIEFIVIPLANPDGYEFSHTSNRQWNKNRQPTRLPECIGIDANANFQFQFRVDDNPCSPNYPGQQAFDAVESNGIQYLLSWGKYFGRVKQYISLQAFGEQILMPFSHGNVAGGNPVVLTNLANRVAAEIRRINPARNYQVGVGGALRTAAFGTSTDYAIGYEGIQYVYTIMLPSGGASGFDPPATSIAGIAGETFYGLLQFGYYAIGQ